MVDFIRESDRRRLFRSGLVSLGVWVIIGAVLLLIPISRVAEKKEKYAPVSITLVSRPVSSAIAADSAVNKAVTAAVPEPVKKTTAQSASAIPEKNNSTAKTPLSKSSGATAPYRASSDSSSSRPAPAGLGIPNFSTPVTSPDTTSTDAEYLEFSSLTESERVSAADKPKGGSPVSELEGVAAVAKKNAEAERVFGKGESRGSSGASEETAAALAEIAGSAKNGAKDTDSARSDRASPSTNASATGVQSPASSSISNFDFDGIPRRLLYPANPVITLPESLSRLVDSDRSVTVSFTVRADGSVPGGLVSFNPSAILPVEIRDYLKKEFTGWRFEKSGEDGQARVVYSIRVE